MRARRSMVTAGLAAALAAGACSRELVVGASEAPADLAPPAAAGNGLKGEYFNDQTLSGSAVTRVDPTVDFDWQNTSPAPPAIGVDFSVRWTGQVEARYSETYTFYAEVDDGARLWIDGRPLIDAWDKGPQALMGMIDLTANTRYTLKLEFVDVHFKALAHLRWSSPSQPKEVIPASQLFPAP